jgi:hypothetical protein
MRWVARKLGQKDGHKMKTESWRDRIIGKTVDLRFEVQSGRFGARIADSNNDEIEPDEF